MKNIALIYNDKKEKNLTIVNELKDFLTKKSLNTIVCKTRTENPEWSKITKEIELAIVLGGDGTLLATSREIAHLGIPILGINTGHLGFLTEGSDNKAESVIEEVLEGKYKIESRSMLSIEVLNGKTEGPFISLNDIVINRSIKNKMLQMKLYIDKNEVADYSADGLIISTPTGSTAYALSAGGAVLDPEIEGIEIVPICAHTLTNRPHVISNKREILITFSRAHEGTTVQIDGQVSFEIGSKSEIKITKSQHTTKLIKLLDSNFYNRVRQKFHVV